MSALGNKPLPWFVISDDSTVVRCSDPHGVFYNDIPKDQAEKYVGMLRDHSYKTFASPVEAEPWRFIPSTFIVCEDDKAIPLEGQLGMIGRAQEMAEGSKFCALLSLMLLFFPKLRISAIQISILPFSSLIPASLRLAAPDPHSQPSPTNSNEKKNLTTKLTPGFDTIERTNSGHSPFISQPEWLAEKLIKAAEASV